MFLVFRWGDTVSLQLNKGGYRPVEKRITWAETDHRFWQKDYQHGSSYGNGAVFPYTIHLQKEDGTQNK